MIKAINTIYNGYRFRSRLEARWAVFFDTLNEPYRYEVEGFELEVFNGDKLYYLPDFYMPKMKIWIEIKPEEFDKKELLKPVELAATGKTVMVISGNPYPGEYISSIIRPQNTQPGELGVSIQEHCVFGKCLLSPNCNCELASYNVDYLESNKLWFLTGTPALEKAYNTARQARFEHGETPKFVRKPKSR